MESAFELEDLLLETRRNFEEINVFMEISDTNTWKSSCKHMQIS